VVLRGALQSRNSRWAARPGLVDPLPTRPDTSFFHVYSGPIRQSWALKGSYINHPRPRSWQTFCRYDFRIHFLCRPAATMSSHEARTLSAMPPALSVSTTPTTELRLTRKEVLQALRNQKIQVPNLAPYFHHWPAMVNPELTRLRADVDNWLDRYVCSQPFGLNSSLLAPAVW
jgi:hypothetical protein